MDFTDFLLGEGSVKKIKNGKALIKFLGKHGEYEYNIDDLEEVKKPTPKKKELSLVSVIFHLLANGT